MTDYLGAAVLHAIYRAAVELEPEPGHEPADDDAVWLLVKGKQGHCCSWLRATQKWMVRVTVENATTGERRLMSQRHDDEATGRAHLAAVKASGVWARWEANQ